MGNFNPGNIGTYEGGTMLIGKMFGLSGATGLALGLSRRLRSLIWAAVGLICFVYLTRPRKRRASPNRETSLERVAEVPSAPVDAPKAPPPSGEIAVAILLPNRETNGSNFRGPLSRVGSLPILLRTILAAKKLGPTRILVVADPSTKRIVQRGLFFTGRLPESVEWMEAPVTASFPEQMELIATQSRSERILLIDGNAAYHPSLLRKASEWKDEGAALALTSGDEPVGIYALPVGIIHEFAKRRARQSGPIEELHALLAEMRLVVSMPIAEDQWQRVCTPEDRLAAERKLDRWLVKPTDGIYARLNRRISIPISRQLIKFPITANMVSIFTLGVGIASAVFFAFGGYWYTLLGAFLCLWASILDGCDGEVARLKLLESDFGCWLETVCDYLFYLFLFVGMTIGLWRSSESNSYLVLGALLLFGAIASFLATGWERHRLAGESPEQLLRIWQSHAESRSSNPFLYFGRHLEFIIRRCFFPYALLFFALFNIMNVAFVISAIAANLVWPIALYSSRAFGGARKPTGAKPATRAQAAPGSREYAPSLP
jgi:phosphatidylglycerophosphate synthase